MDNENLQTLISKAGEMALGNMWGENAYEINMAILQIDSRNTAACTRLAKYYRLNCNIAEAKKMYLKALEIDPANRGAINNLNDIEKEEQENEMIEHLGTGSELFKAGQDSIKKGKYELAIKLLQKAYGTEPLIKYAVRLAGVYKKLGRYDSIKSLYNQLIADNNVNADVDAINDSFAAFIKK